MNELISVIVPIYNIEPYIEKCITSILSQKYSNFELLLIDDGSPDNCGVICDEIAKTDNRIKVFHKPNGGLSDARNYGLKMSTGTLISFVDGDDYVDSHFLESMINVMNSENCEIVECRSIKFEDGEKPSADYKAGFSTFLPKEWLTETNLNDFISCAVWNKLYRKSLFNGISFPVNRHYEDEATTYKVVYNARKIVRLNASLYFYRQRDGSITQSEFSKKEIDDKFLALEEKCLYFEMNNELDISCFAYAKLAIFMIKNFHKRGNIKSKGWYAYILKIFIKIFKTAAVPIKYKAYILFFLIFPFGIYK